MALAEGAAGEGWAGIVAVGGDGIVHEVANGLLRAAGERPTMPMGAIAAGSGNDFVKMIGLWRCSPQEAGRRIAAAEPRAVDVGEVTRWQCEAGPPAPWFFTNGIGLGFDAQVAVRARRIRRLRGLAIYVAAALRALRELGTPRMRVVVDGVEVADRRLVLTTVANGGCHGGNFWLCPAARIDDGVFDVLVGDARGVWKVVQLIPQVMRGTHVGDPSISIHQGRRVTITSEEPLPIHADGEVIGAGVREIEMRVVADRLRVLA